MMYKLDVSEYGDYVKIEDDGKRYFINECNAAFTPQGMNVGYTFFASREECLETWGLKEIEENSLFLDRNE